MMGKVRRNLTVLILLLLAPLAPACAAAPLPVLSSPPALAGAALEPASFDDLPGWRKDDQAAAFKTFLASCRALVTPPRETGPTSNPALMPGLRQACAAAWALRTDAPADIIARLFFEANFRAYRIVPAQNPPGFLTGYYEPEVDGSPVRTDTYPVPVYARPPDLIPTNPAKDGNRGGAQRREGRALVPYYDRAEIEDGALIDKGLEIAWLEHPVDLFFMQIQGSARIRLTDGRVLRLNYDGHNGYPYTPVGRLLIQSGLVPRDEMSMDRIRRFIEDNPEAGRDLMRKNRSYVFFKAVPLSGEDGALGAQGVPLTDSRSIAVDRAIHSYGAPFFIAADLPLQGADSLTSFHRLMIAQDTGSAIVGPARADLFFGSGTAAGAVAGRIRHPGAFFLLVPRFSGAPP